MNRRQSIIIASTALVVIILAVWLGLKFFTKKPSAPVKNNQAVSLDKTTYKDRLAILQDLFAQQLGKTPQDVIIQIAREDNTHIKGIVTAAGLYEGVFLAERGSGEWKIVWDGQNGKYSCESIKNYSFPGEMVSDCLK